MLVYHPQKIDALFQRYPGGDGGLYFVAGVGGLWVQDEDTEFPLIRFGVGWRKDTSVGYLQFVRKKSWNPF